MGGLGSSLIVPKKQLSASEQKYIRSLVLNNVRKTPSNTSEREERMVENHRKKEIFPRDD